MVSENPRRDTPKVIQRPSHGVFFIGRDALDLGIFSFNERHNPEFLDTSNELLEVLVRNSAILFWCALE